LGGTLQLFFSSIPLPTPVLAISKLVLPGILIWKMTYTYLMIWGFVPNPRMSKVNKDMKRVMGAGRHGTEEGCVVMIASQCTHPLGHFFPSYRFSEHTNAMIAELERTAPRSGFLGSTSWLNSAQHSSGNMIMTLMYFKTREDVVRFSRGRAHGKGAEWSKALGGGGIGGGEYVGMYQENFMRGGDW
jgi:hypothetical protein